MTRDTTFCTMVGRAYLQLRDFHIDITDLAHLTNTYISWHEYGVKLGDINLAYHSGKAGLPEYIEKSRYYSLCKYKAMRKIVQFMDKHLKANRPGAGAEYAKNLYDELFGINNWERSLNRLTVDNAQ